MLLPDTFSPQRNAASSARADARDAAGKFVHVHVDRTPARQLTHNGDPTHALKKKTADREAPVHRHQAIRPSRGKRATEGDRSD